ncbi:hypothetical protein MHZ92_20920 [Sporosarcina sp. ACRSL]|uniref:hypothetical protein n=1 Tax=Sporosarcina sp. ACRSL TaxID=2918215 RepID=UPI001EF3EBFA|nr:hypothetical protein [Sporosarcina sp. ACRSL]MCG7346568.1 hypothetical protein [Sporosarcina sp. ACRSL]
MDNDNFEKRMEFLKKSYDRVPSNFNPDDVLQKIDEEGNIRPIEKKKTHRIRQRLTVWTVSIASVFVIGLIGAGYVFDEKQQADETVLDSEELDDYIEELKAKYEVEREKRREMLKLDEEYFEQYAGPGSIPMLSFESYVNNVKKSKNAKEILLQEFNRAVEGIKLPSEMIQDLKSKPLTEDEEESIAFIATYRQKVKRLIAIYDQIVEENREAIQEYEVDPNIDKAEIMMYSSKSFPEQLQNIINTMKDQSIKLQTGKYSGEIEARYYDSSLHRELQGKLHDNTFGYQKMLTEEPYMYGAVLELPVHETVWSVASMEYTLVNVEQDSTLYPVLKSYYITLFNELMKGSEYTKIFDGDGVLLPEYQEAWRSMASGGQATPMRYILDPIITEMEASGWRESASWDSLDYYDLEEALVLYREGVLEEYMYGERPDFQDITVHLPDDSFDKEVQSLYADFKMSHDKSLLKGVSPIHVLGVFDYANKMDDPQTMYYLYNKTAFYDESGIDYTLDFYVDNWKKGLSFFRNATEVKFFKDRAFRNDRTFHSAVIFPGLDREVSMIYTEEGIWEVGTMRMDSLPSYHSSPERDFKNDVMDMSAFYYEGLVSVDNVDSHLRWIQPLEIIGMYFYAGEKGFFETQYELFYKGDGSEVVDKETYVQNPEKYFLPFDEKMYTKISFQGFEQDENGNWPGIATLTVDTELYPGLPSERKFHMLWTEDGWRVKFKPFE